MELVTAQNELTAAATDACLAVVALASAAYLYRLRKRNSWKIMVWCSVLFLLALGSFLGVFVHGFKLSSSVFNVLWILLYLSLALAVAFFATSATYDGWGLSASRRVLPFVFIAGCAFTIVLHQTGNFLLFILYEGVAMLFALGVYLWLVIMRKLPGAFLITCGILLTIIAAIVQTDYGIKFTIIWQFDNNGLFHFIQMIGVVFVALGVRRSVLMSGKAGKFSSAGLSGSKSFGEM
jgi:hypothetical protein